MELSLYQTKTNFSNVIQMIIDEKEDAIIVTKNGKPVAKIVPFNGKKAKRLGLLKKAKGDFDISLEEFNSIDVSDEFGEYL